MKRRQSDIGLLVMQMFLPLLVLITLGVAPRASALETPKTEAPISSSENLIRLHRSLAFEPWQTSLWDEVLNEEASRQLWPQVISDGEQALKWQSLSDEGKWLLGEAYERNGLSQLAWQVWQMVDVSGRPQQYQKVILALRYAGEMDKALEILQRWSVQEPQNADLYYQQALIQCVLSPDDAVPLLDQAALYDISLLDKVRTLKQAVAIRATAHDQAYHLVVMGRALGSLNEWDLARQSFQQAVNAKPDYAEAWAFLGEANYQMGLEEYNSLKQALSLNPNSVSALSFAGLYWMRKDHPDLAYTYFYQLTCLEPQRALWRFQTGDALAQMGQPIYGMVHYQKGLALEPEDPQNWRLMAAYCLKYHIEQRRLGLPAARRLVLMTPNDAQAYDLHGNLLLALEDKDSALRVFENGLKRVPQSALLHLDAGNIYAEQQRWDEARESLQQAVTLGREQNNNSVVERALYLLGQIG